MRVWDRVAAEFTDDKGDVFHRDHFGYGRIGRYINNTGRNDIVLSKVANDGECLYFYVKTEQPLTSCNEKKWMRLFLDVKGSCLGNWEGFQYMVNNSPIDSCSTSLEICNNGWNWKKCATLNYRTEGNEMVIAIPMQAVGIHDPNDFSIDFKWIDNAVEEGDIQECLIDGDSAPNGRFRYRYTFKK